MGGDMDLCLCWCLRMRELSPVILTRTSTAAKSSQVDVHEAVRKLVEAATNQDNLCAMPSSFQAWL